MLLFAPMRIILRRFPRELEALSCAGCVSFRVCAAPSGSNLTIEVLHNTLMELVALQSDGSSLPRSLFIMMDNCSRENKNK